MIFITGDTHVPIDMDKLFNNPLLTGNLTKNDYLIICGDFGGVWNKSKYEMELIQLLNDLNYTILFIDGNHENFDLLNAYPVDIFNGGNVHKISDSIYHLMRGQIFNIDGITFFTMGGATSVDRYKRIESFDWWSQEIPTMSEYNTGLDNLDAINNNVDYIITHAAPNTILNKIADYYEHDSITGYLEVIKDTVNYKRWFFGHYHIDNIIDNRHICMFNNVIKIM